MLLLSEKKSARGGSEPRLVEFTRPQTNMSREKTWYLHCHLFFFFLAVCVLPGRGWRRISSSSSCSAPGASFWLKQTISFCRFPRIANGNPLSFSFSFCTFNKLIPTSFFSLCVCVPLFFSDDDGRVLLWACEWVLTLTSLGAYLRWRGKGKLCLCLCCFSFSGYLRKVCALYGIYSRAQRYSTYTDPHTHIYIYK